MGECQQARHLQLFALKKGTLAMLGFLQFSVSFSMLGLELRFQFKHPPCICLAITCGRHMVSDIHSNKYDINP